MKLPLFIRCDASTQIGMGHLVRCSALAEMLKEKFEITFFCKDIPASYKQGLKFNITQILVEDDFLQHVNDQSIVVLDGYHFKGSYQRSIKNLGAILVCIVDFPDYDFLADLIINHAPSVNTQNYRVQAYTHFALGLDYVLLRPPFLRAAQNTREISKVESVAICFGGSDAKNLTQRALSVVKEYSEFKKIILVVGQAYNYDEELKASIKRDLRVELHKGIDSEQMLQIMLLTQVVIVSASSVLLEAMAARCCIISGAYVDNQKIIYESFRKDGVFVDAGNFSVAEIKNAVESVLKKVFVAPKAIDGLSNKRLLKKFIQLSISNQLKLRIATENDLQTTYQWATHPAIRAFAFQQNKIEWEEHVEWFRNKLKDEKCIYFMAEHDGAIIGSVRFDVRDNEAVISYLVDPHYQSKGYGLILLAKSFEEILNELKNRRITTRDLVGYVMENNYPSSKTFVNLGFREIKVDGKLKFVKSLYGSIN